MSARGRSAATRVDATPTPDTGKTALRARHHGVTVDVVPRDGATPLLFAHTLGECLVLEASAEDVLAVAGHPRREIVAAWRTPAWASSACDVGLGARTAKDHAREREDGR